MTGQQGPVRRPYPRPGDWVRRAACVGVDPHVFYQPGRGNLRATAICTRCTVAAECLDYALACEDLDPFGGWGIWAGLTGSQRNDIRAQLKETS